MNLEGSCFSEMRVYLCLQGESRWIGRQCALGNVLVINALVCVDFQVELLLDKLKQKGAIRRALFLHNRSPGHAKTMTVFRGGQTQCEELVAYLRVRHFPHRQPLLVATPSLMYMIFPTCKSVFS